MSDTVTVSAAAQRAAEHVKTLRESGAPHQQELAADLEALIAQAAAPEAKEQLRTLRQNIDKALDDRDLAKKALEDHKRAHQATLDDKLGHMKQELADAKRELLEANKMVAQMEIEKSKLGVASAKGETVVDIKAKAKK